MIVSVVPFAPSTTLAELIGRFCLAARRGHIPKRQAEAERIANEIENGGEGGADAIEREKAEKRLTRERECCQQKGLRFKMLRLFI